MYLMDIKDSCDTHYQKQLFTGFTISHGWSFVPVQDVYLNCCTYVWPLGLFLRLIPGAPPLTGVLALHAHPTAFISLCKSQPSRKFDPDLHSCFNTSQGHRKAGRVLPHVYLCLFDVISLSPEPSSPCCSMLQAEKCTDDLKTISTFISSRWHI